MLLTRPSLARVVPPNFPGVHPISESDCDEYQRVMRMSGAQRYALGRIYEHYLEQYGIRVAGIPEPATGNNTESLDGAIEAFDGQLSYLRRLRAAQAMLDAEFFEQIAMGLADHQRGLLEHVMHRRSLHTRACDRFLMQTGRPWIDHYLIAQVMTLDSPTVDLIIAEYDRASSRSMARVDLAEFEVAVGLLRDFREQGFGDDFGAMGEARPQMWNRRGEQFLRHCRALDALAETARRQIEEHLDERQRLEWNLRWSVAAYPELHSLIDRQWRAQWACRAIGETDPEKAEAASEIQQRLAHGVSQVVAESRVLAERHSPFAYLDEEHWRACEAQENLVDEVTQTWLDEYKRFRSSLDARTLQVWTSAWAAAPDLRLSEANDDEPTDEGDADRRLGRIMDQIGIVLREVGVGEELAARWIEIERAVMGELSAMRSDEPPTMSPLTDAQLEHLERRLVIVEEQLRARIEFESDRARRLLEQAMAVVRRRARSMFTGEAGATALDLTSVLQACDFELAAREHPALLAYGASMEPIVDARRAAIVRGNTAEVMALNRRAAEITWSCMDDILSRNEPHRRVLESLLLQSGFPQVLRVARRADTPILAALQLEDLTDDQSMELHLSRVEVLEREALLRHRLLMCVRHAIWWRLDEGEGIVVPGGEPKAALEVRAIASEFRQLEGLARRRIRETLSDAQLARLASAVSDTTRP